MNTPHYKCVNSGFKKLAAEKCCHLFIDFNRGLNKSKLFIAKEKKLNEKRRLDSYYSQE